MRLSPHFTLEEFTVSQTAARLGLKNKPTPEVIENLKRLTVLLEEIRALYGKPLTISSGYRSAQVNRIVGGASNSQHTLGCAVDFIISGIPLRSLVTTIIKSGLAFDQLILEYGSWVHVSIPSKKHYMPRKQALIIDSKGTRSFK